MNRHRRMEAKRARRRARLARETPRQRTAREARLVARVDDGAARLLRMFEGAPSETVKGGPVDRYIERPCACDPPRRHGPHFRVTEGSTA